MNFLLADWKTAGLVDPAVAAVSLQNSDSNRVPTYAVMQRLLDVEFPPLIAWPPPQRKEFRRSMAVSDRDWAAIIK